PNDRLAHSLHAYFLRAASTSEGIDYDVQNLRDGGSFSARHVRALQHQRVCFEMSASFHIDEPGLYHADPMPTDTDPPEECRPLTAVMDERFEALSIWHEWDCLDVRFAGDSSTASTNENRGRPEAWMRVWVKTAGDLPADAPPQLHQAVLAYLSDLTLLSVSTLPHEVEFLSTGLQTASLSHSMWFHRPCRADRWLLYDTQSPNAHGSLGFSTGHLYQDGQLVASCAQEGLVRLVESRPVLT
ncbi:MAG: thioesterase family protein, partial [Propionibacteriaceae bacterium]|nr:thioesterase family protein [Propionibacteriaceae bacterium]